ncbi:NUAK SNF1-like kinase 2 [Linnemannia exigua]|uniref:NUAK SNF1-like kinase 2 n=1 Tax=Linnemannia exigua TaxID=604196 RepID=A0AAD4D5A1_9FUNG|nr:NUAK SNF1-like kinase 2 [Linnemannia exigua]
MNTAAPAPSHTIRQDPYTAERISAQEAMKGMRISEPHQNVHRRKSTDIDETYGASRIDRHLAHRAQSVRESSKYASEKEVAPLKLVPTPASIERRRSKAESITESPTHGGSKNSNHTMNISNNNNNQYRQPQQQSFSTAAATSPTAVTATQPPVVGELDHGSHSAPTNEFHNQKAPIPTSPSSPVDNNGSSTQQQQQQPPASGRQSRLSNVSSTKESYRRKYGEIQGYTYIGTIGQGNFGKVLLAENDITGEQVAVKILEKAQFKSEQQRLHATREARLMATLRHPNIVDVKTVMEDNYRILIVMENLTGGELFDYISNKGSLDEKEARRIFQQIVLAIHYCHENNVVHRDLKPENILLDSERNVRVADFGFGNNWHKDRHLTTYCGSPFYAAPEMVSGTPYIGPETDVWSLGVILYVLVCGRLPFDASDLPALFAQIKRGNYQKPREGSIDVCSLIHRMLTVDPKRRATLTDVLRSRWMRTDGMDTISSTLPALSTAPATMRPPLSTTRTPAVPQQQQQAQARSTGLPTFHPNEDISKTMNVVTTAATIPAVVPAPPTVNTNRHSYHPPGSDPDSGAYHPYNNNNQQHSQSHQHHHYQYPYQQQHQHQHRHNHQMDHSPSPSPQSPVPDLYDHDEHMSDVSPSMINSPTETMATISPSTPIGPTSRDEALAAAAAANGAVIHHGGGGVIITQHSSYQKRSNTMNSTVMTGSGDDKHQHHPYKQNNRPHSVHTTNGAPATTGPGDAVVTITMCPSNDALTDGFDSSSKKKRKTLTKLRQFFRFETAAKC